jgi:DnaJ homologue, subfamily C, member 28, conserved domain
MTERKPKGMSFTSWIDQQIADAEERGVFDNLPGAGKPLELKQDRDADYGQAWMRDYARREGVSPEEFLPTPLRLRREIERLAEAVGNLGSEDEVREMAGDLNRRVLEWRRIPVGPPVFVPLVHVDDMVERWRAAHAAKRPPTPAQVPEESAPAAPPRTARPRWWRRGRAGLRGRSR